MMTRRPAHYIRSTIRTSASPDASRLSSFFNIGLPSPINVQAPKEVLIEQIAQDQQKSENELWDLGDYPTFEDSDNDQFDSNGITSQNSLNGSLEE
jgi:hypothetical protein